MSRLLLLAAAAAAAITAAVAASALVDLAPSGSAQRCAVGDERSYGTTYVLSIGVFDVTCAAARRVTRAFHACRPGKRGRCRGTVAGYRCRERRFNKSSISYDSRVRCKRGGRRVMHTYTQFT